MIDGADRWGRTVVGCAVAVVLLAVGGLTNAQTTKAGGNKAATQAAGQEGWAEIDQRLVFLTVQLSTIESSIDATDKALKQHGYQKIAKEAAAEAARQKNEAMDRKGGGPVPWEEFYGKTAEKFFYHPKDVGTVHVNPRPAAQRPPQFDFIYRANEDNRQRAEAEADRIGGKIEDLLAYRRQLEAEQAALWCKIAFRGCSSMELSTRPMYRAELGGGGGGDGAGKQAVDGARAAVAFMRAIDAELAAAQKGLDDPKATFARLLEATTAARADLQDKFLALPALAPQLASPRDPLGQFSRLSKRLEDAAQNLADAWRLAADCDAKDDLAGKRTYRGQLQQSAVDYAAGVVAADGALTAAIAAWKLAPAPAVAVKGPDPAAAENDPVRARLDAAIGAHEKEIAAARRELVAALDARLNAYADAGDLAGVQTYQAAKIAAARDGSLAGNVTDLACLVAKKRLDQAVSTSNARLVAAYREAISGYTKARKIHEAVGVQDELNASKLAVETEPVGGATAAVPKTPAALGAVTAADGSFSTPDMPNGKLEVDLSGPADEVAVGGGGRFLILHIKKLRQLAVFDVSQAKVLKYLPIPSSDICFTASAKKLFVGMKDLKRIQRWDLAKLELELTVAAPEGGIGAIAAGADSQGLLVMLASQRAKRFWALNPSTLQVDTFPSKNWGTDGSAWGPVNVHVSFDGSTVVASGGGWAGIELSNISGNQVSRVQVQTGGYVNGDALVAGNGGLVFPDGGSMLRSDLASKVSGVDGKAFPAVDPAFSVAFQKDKEKPSLVVFSNADPRPLVTLRDVPELAQDSKMPMWQRVHLIPRGNVLVTLAQGGGRLILRKFDLAQALEAEGIDYLFVESAPVCHAQRGGRYTYKMRVRSKRGGVKAELQSGPRGMTVSKDGQIAWSVPLRPDEDNAMVIVQISDASGQTIFHSFGIDVGDGSSRR